MVVKPEIAQAAERRLSVAVQQGAAAGRCPGVGDEW